MTHVQEDPGRPRRGQGKPRLARMSQEVNPGGPRRTRALWPPGALRNANSTSPTPRLLGGAWVSQELGARKLGARRSQDEPGARRSQDARKPGARRSQDPGSSWLLLALPGSSWLLMAAPGSFWLFLDSSCFKPRTERESFSWIPAVSSLDPGGSPRVDFGLLACPWFRNRDTERERDTKGETRGERHRERDTERDTQSPQLSLVSPGSV